MTTVKGRANTIVAVCTALTPPATNKMAAIPATSRPHITLTLLLGLG